MKNLYKLAGVSLLLALVFGISACNTVKGVGEDVRAGGEAIRRSAE